MSWYKKNFKLIICCAFLIPILSVCFVSISHVTLFYGLSNPISWATFLSVGVEAAALSSMAALSVNLRKHIYVPFFIITSIQFIGNVFFAYEYINITSQSFKDWVGLVKPIASLVGIDNNDLDGQRRFLAIFEGGLLPVISLLFLGILVKFLDNYKEEVLVAEEPEKESISTSTIKENIDIPVENKLPDNPHTKSLVYSNRNEPDHQVR